MTEADNGNAGLRTLAAAKVSAKPFEFSALCLAVADLLGKRTEPTP